MCSHGWEPLARSFPSHYFNWLSYRICLESTAHQPINAVWILEIIHFSLLMSEWPVVLASRVLLSYFLHPSVKDVLGTVCGEKIWVWNSSVFNFWQDLTVVLSSGGCDRGHAGGEENTLVWLVTQTNVNSSKDLISSHLQPLPTVFSPSPKTGSRDPFNSKLSRYPSLPSTSPTMVLCSTSKFLERRMYILSFSFSLWWHLPTLSQPNYPRLQMAPTFRILLLLIWLPLLCFLCWPHLFYSNFKFQSSVPNRVARFSK